MKARDVLALAAKGQWGAYKAWLKTQAPEAAYESIKFVYEACPLDTDVRAVVDGDDDVLGLALAGALHFGIGKRHRGMGVAATLTEDQIDPYFQHSILAQGAIDAALAADRHDGLAAAFNMALAIDPWEEDQKARAEAVLLEARDVPLSGYMNLLTAFLEKWGGDHDTMFRIARSRMRPEAPMQYALIAKAHWERYLFYIAFDEAPDARQRAINYFSGEVMDELREASRAVLAGREADPAEQRVANSWLAFTYSRAGRDKQAVPHLDRIKGHNEPAVWALLPGSPAITKAMIRFRALLS